MGELVVIEGLDGSGKATQSALFATAIGQARQVQTISFPDYNHKSSTLVQMYLNGEIGDLDTVNIYGASSLYSLDRYISYETIWGKAYQEGTTIVADRYTTSNLSHQMVKLPPEKWDEYIQWLEHYEYELLALPRPNLVIYLDMHPKTSRQLMKERYGGDEKKMDIHEQNFAYLQSCRTAGLYCAEKLGWMVISCNDEEYRPLEIETIAEKVLEVYNTYKE